MYCTFRDLKHGKKVPNRFQKQSQNYPPYSSMNELLLSQVTPLFIFAIAIIFYWQSRHLFEKKTIVIINRKIANLLPWAKI